MSRSLVIGFGNIDRADDGVAYHIVNALRNRLGKEGLGEGDTGLEGLGEQTDTVFLAQLVPELIELLADYGRIIFVDAHVDQSLGDLHCGRVRPESASPVFSHHMTPAMLLALTSALHGREPAGYLVSVRGGCFDFHQGLSPGCEALVEPAVCNILELLNISAKSAKFPKRGNRRVP
ncbi:MAG: Hydrogenase 2 maturation protease [Syntrophaceae bacterium PtaU1.Bin231]|nr:MAG: Hydrogenase 2 maturation protease [Syntrophaceae bacterium PtaU1.Bin231]